MNIDNKVAFIKEIQKLGFTRKYAMLHRLHYFKDNIKIVIYEPSNMFHILIECLRETRHAISIEVFDYNKSLEILNKIDSGEL